MVKYTVNTEEAFFNRFKDMQREVQSLSSFFQNEGMELTVKEVAGLKENFDQFEKGFKQLRKEAEMRLIKKAN